MISIDLATQIEPFLSIILEHNLLTLTGPLSNIDASMWSIKNDLFTGIEFTPRHDGHILLQTVVARKELVP